MLKKLLALALIIALASCGGSSKVYSSKKSPGGNGRKAVTTRTKKTSTGSGSRATSSGDRRTEVLESTSRTVVYAELVKQYVLDFKDIAKDNMRRHGIPASIILAQGILESGAGRGTLCVSANNHFGIKCHNDWNGDKVYHDDDSEQECFRKYERAAESYNDHALFLTTRGRYAQLFKLDKDDYAAWARGLKAAGYATDPKYPEKLIGLIERYELARYDAEVLGQPYTPVVKSPAPATRASDLPKPVQEPVTLAAGSHMVQQGDTLYSISRKYNTTVDELMRINGLSGNAISIGQVLKVK